MKKIVVSILMSALCCSFAFAGCSKPVDDSENTLEIAYYDAGYGYSFIEKWGEKFEAAHPGVSVVLSKSSDVDPKDLLSAGPGGNSVDLFIHGTVFNSYAYMGEKMLKGYDCVLEPIDDVLESEIDGQKISERFMDGYEPKSVNGHYYSFSWATGMTGLVYNATKFEKAGYEVPNTTKELLALCGKIKADSQIPFVFSSATGYWSYLRNVWYMQYQGVDGMLDFFNGVDDGSYSRDVFLQKGRLVSLQTLDSLINVEKKYCHNSVNTFNFTQAQAQLLLGNGLMMVNGDWLENEMKSLEEEDENQFTFRMMNTPVVSEIIEQCPTIPDDAALSKVIDFVDGNLDRSEIADVSDADIARISEARHCRHSIGGQHTVGIPVYATAKKLAKEFLKYMATDEAQLIYMECTSGNMLPFKYDIEKDEAIWSEKSEYSKSIYRLSKGAIYY
ncbi:MAG: extracellular solute-binding protein, partial [Firmicutes bacterium]|nr:extracellular solute-binding protein [Bacillota bacterium]